SRYGVRRSSSFSIRLITAGEQLHQGIKSPEKIRDILDEQLRGHLNKKPKTYRKLSRKKYLKVGKQRKQKSKPIRKAMRKQLQDIPINLGHIDKLI
ncbi:MAG: IS5/IS1182 family transposase, partial [Moorea sp. SIO2B7]|nr:IS5/IS1182 family transposase [Moorena sp. SIO2B7]